MVLSYSMWFITPFKDNLCVIRPVAQRPVDGEPVSVAGGQLRSAGSSGLLHQLCRRHAEGQGQVRVASIPSQQVRVGAYSTSPAGTDALNTSPVDTGGHLCTPSQQIRVGT